MLPLLLVNLITYSVIVFVPFVITIFYTNEFLLSYAIGFVVIL